MSPEDWLLESNLRCTAFTVSANHRETAQTDASIPNSNAGAAHLETGHFPLSTHAVVTTCQSSLSRCLPFLQSKNPDEKSRASYSSDTAKQKWQEDCHTKFGSKAPLCALKATEHPWHGTA